MVQNQQIEVTVHVGWVDEAGTLILSVAKRRLDGPREGSVISVGSTGHGKQICKWHDPGTWNHDELAREGLVFETFFYSHTDDSACSILKIQGLKALQSSVRCT